MYRDIPAELKAMIEPVCLDHGCELVDAAVRRGGPGLLRVTIDSERGDGQVPVDTLARLSREIETQLDASDWMGGEYNLEVSSPGLDRVLGREKDFRAAMASGSEVKLQTKQPLDGRRKFTGVLVGFEGSVARLRASDCEVDIHFDQIEKANTVYRFTRDDFKGRAAE